MLFWEGLCSSPNSYIDVLTPEKVTAFGDGVFKEVVKVQ